MFCHDLSLLLNWQSFTPLQLAQTGRSATMLSMTLNPDVLIKVCEEAARAGADQLVAWRDKFQWRQKFPRDLVTDADLASEQAIRRVISRHFPDHGILGEEAPAPDELERPYCWIVDPLDGTTNYAHGLPCFAVSIGVAHLGQLQAGVVLDPERQECFSAAAGGGATLNGKPIMASRVEAVEAALAAISFPAQLVEDSPDLRAFLRTAYRCQAIRRTGSAALNLAYVACGRLDAHWAHEIHPWDAAAGVLLVQEAGGIATATDGQPFDLATADYLAAATPALHLALLPLIAL